MDEYICREDVLKAFKLIAKNPNKDYQRGMQDTIDCLLREYQNSHKERPMKLLANRGFDKAAILYELELRGA